MALLSLFAIVLGTLFWPWALENPLLRPLQALQTFSRFTLTFNELYKGRTDRYGQYPRRLSFALAADHDPVGSTFFWGRFPRLFALLVRKKYPDICPVRVAGILFAVLFPLAYVIATKPVLYNGPRHLLFIYPPFVVLAAGMPALLLRWRKRLLATAVVCCLIILGFYHPVHFCAS